MTATTKSPATPKSPAKPKPVIKSVTVFHSALEQFGSQLAIYLSSGEAIHGCIDIMRKTKVQLGSIKSKCQFAIAVQELLKNLVYTNQAGKQCKLASGSIANYLSSIRQCLKDHNRVFSKNPARDAKAKAKVKTESTGTAPESIPSVDKTSAEKIAVQINNALVICQNDDTPDYDVVTVSKLLAQILVLIKQ